MQSIKYATLPSDVKDRIESELKRKGVKFTDDMGQLEATRLPNKRISVEYQGCRVEVEGPSDAVWDDLWKTMAPVGIGAFILGVGVLLGKLLAGKGK